MSSRQMFTPLNDFVSGDAPICYGILKPGQHIDGGVPVVKVKNIYSGQVHLSGLLRTSQKIHSQYKRAELKSGDLLLTIRGTTGRVAIVPTELDGANITQDSARIRVSTEDCPLYLFYALQSPLTQRFISLNTVGQAVKGINISEVKKLNVFHPPVSEQRKIAKILSTWDKAIATTEKLIAASKQQKKALMQQLLTGKKRLVNPETGRVFEGEWEKKLFKNILKLDRGSSPRPIVSYITEDEDGVNWIKIGDTKGNDLFINSTKQKITKEGAKKSRKVSKGEVIVSNSMSYGKPYILNIDGYIHDGWFVIRNYEKDFDIQFLLQLLASELIQSQYKRLAAGGVVSNISSDLVYAVKVTLPDLIEQQKIAQVLTTADQEIEHLESKLAHFQQEKKALMQQLLTGKRRVKVEEMAFS